MTPIVSGRYYTYFSILTLLVISLFMLSGCEEPTKKASIRYHDIAGFVKQQKARLIQQHAKLVKTGGTDGKLSTVSLDSVNWGHELDPFLQADINKPSWQGFFKQDSSIHGDTVVFNYAPTKEELTVRALTVKTIAGHGIKSFTARVVKLSALSDVTLDLVMTIRPDGKLFYSTNAVQKIILQDKGTVTVAGLTQ